MSLSEAREQVDSAVRDRVHTAPTLHTIHTPPYTPYTPFLTYRSGDLCAHSCITTRSSASLRVCVLKCVLDSFIKWLAQPSRDKQAALFF